MFTNTKAKKKERTTEVVRSLYYRHEFACVLHLKVQNTKPKCKSERLRKF